MSDVDNLYYSSLRNPYEKSAFRNAAVFAFTVGVVAFFAGLAVGTTRSKREEKPRTIRLQLEVLGAGASAPTITTTNETEKETTGND